MIVRTVWKIVASTRLETTFLGKISRKNILIFPQILAPLYFVVFVLLAQFVLVNVVVAVLMKHLEETHKQVKFEDLFLVQCFNLVSLQFKEKLLNMVGRDLNRKSMKMKQDLTQKIETYFD